MVYLGKNFPWSSKSLEFSVKQKKIGVYTLQDFFKVSTWARLILKAKA